MRIPRLTTLSVMTVLSIMATAVTANENNNDPVGTESTESTAPAEIPAEAIRVNLTEGSIEGFVFQNVQDQQKPVPAKVTLAASGKTIDTQMTDENGVFKFAGVEPGVYTVVGTASGMVGDQMVEVGTFETTNAAFTQMPLEVAPGYDAGVVYDSYGDYPVETFAEGAPVQSYGYGSGGCSSCGGGGGGGCGGGGFGRLLPLVGLVGLAGLAGNDDPHPASPYAMH